MKKLAFITILCLFQIVAIAQDDKKKKDKPEKEKTPLSEKLYYTGGITLNFTNNITQVGASPTIGYKFTPFLSLGLGANYQYLDYRTQDYDTHAYGGRVFLRGKLPNNVFGTIEYETLSGEFGSVGNRKWYSALLAGAGYSAQLNQIASMNVMILYNLSFNSTNSLYNREFVPRVEFAYNF